MKNLWRDYSAHSREWKEDIAISTRGLHREVLSNYDIMTVGETPAVTVREACQYAANQQSELSMVFQFELMDVDGGESGKWNDKKYQLQDVSEGHYERL